MSQDLKALDFVLTKINDLEPVAILEMHGIGKDIIYSALVERLNKIEHTHNIKSFHIQSIDDFPQVIQELEEDKFPTVLIVNLTLYEDASSFIKKLDQIRNNRSTKFVPVILSNLAPVISNLLIYQKILLTGLYILRPISFNDWLILAADFEERFSFNLTPTQRKEIYTISSGHVGLLKSLFLLQKEYPEKNLIKENLLNYSSILFRLERLANDLPEQKDLLEQFGFLKNGKFFNPLFYDYLTGKKIGQSQDFLLDFTKQERQIFELLSANKNTLITREQVADKLWGEEKEEHYSDWAIDMLVSRLRKKLREKNVHFEIKTRKGQGFILID